MEGNFFSSDDDDGSTVKQKPNLVTVPTGSQSNESSGCFDCNICLDTALDPVVTLCGHLFCWPCIYKWLHVQLSSSSLSIDHHHHHHHQNNNNNNNNCPVCKSNIAITSLVPLYGRGISSPSFDSKEQQDSIPSRPSPSNNPTTPDLPLRQHRTMSPTFHNHHRYSSRGFTTTTESTDLANAVMMSLLYPVIGMFGDMVYTRIFGTFTNAIAQPYQQNQRMMQTEKSLNRVSIFFFFCIFLCLLLF